MSDAIGELGQFVKGGGEGSRGGKVVGHRADGSPIYESADEGKKERAAAHKKKMEQIMAERLQARKEKAPKKKKGVLRRLAEKVSEAGNKPVWQVGKSMDAINELGEFVKADGNWEQGPRGGTRRRKPGGGWEYKREGSQEETKVRGAGSWGESHEVEFQGFKIIASQGKGGWSAHIQAKGSAHVLPAGTGKTAKEAIATAKKNIRAGKAPASDQEKRETIKQLALRQTPDVSKRAHDFVLDSPHSLHNEGLDGLKGRVANADLMIRDAQFRKDKEAEAQAKAEKSVIQKYLEHRDTIMGDDKDAMRRAMRDVVRFAKVAFGQVAESAQARMIGENKITAYKTKTGQWATSIHPKKGAGNVTPLPGPSAATAEEALNAAEKMYRGAGGGTQKSMDAIDQLGEYPLQKAQPSASADVSPEKARQILHDGEVNGHPLTEKQRRFFGAIGGHLPAPKGKKSMTGIDALGDYLAKADTTTTSPQPNAGDAGKIPGDNAAGAGGLPHNETNFNARSPEDGGPLENAGKGNVGSGPNPPNTSGEPAGKDKLSADDEYAESQMKPAGDAEFRGGQQAMQGRWKKSMPENYTKQELEHTVARERAIAEAQLRKGEGDVVIDPRIQDPRTPDPEQVEKAQTFRHGDLVTYSNASDLAVERLEKSGDDFYHGAPPAIDATGTLRKSTTCSNGHSMPAMLSSCPTCGDGASHGFNVPPGAGIHEVAPQLLKSGRGLIPVYEPDVIIVDEDE